MRRVYRDFNPWTGGVAAALACLAFAGVADAACVRHRVKVELTPIEATAAPGTTQTFVVRIQNRDTRGCDDQTYFGVNCGLDNTQQVEGYDPATTYCDIDPSPGFLLRPAQKARARIRVHVGAGTGGMVDVTATAIRDGRAFENEDRSTLFIE